MASSAEHNTWTLDVIVVKTGEPRGRPTSGTVEPWGTGPAPSTKLYCFCSDPCTSSSTGKEFEFFHNAIFNQQLDQKSGINESFKKWRCQACYAYYYFRLRYPPKFDLKQGRYVEAVAAA